MEDFGNVLIYFSKIKKKTFVKVNIFENSRKKLKNSRKKTKTQAKNSTSRIFDSRPRSKLMFKKMPALESYFSLAKNYWVQVALNLEKKSVKKLIKWLISRAQIERTLGSDHNSWASDDPTLIVPFFFPSIRKGHDGGTILIALHISCVLLVA